MESLSPEELLPAGEETERSLIRTMALVIVAGVAGGVLLLAIRAWMQKQAAQTTTNAGTPAAGR